MSSNGFSSHGDGGNYVDPFGDTPQESSVVRPLKIGKKRGSINGGSRVSSFGLPRHRAPSTSATSDFAMGVARVASIGNASPIAENDDMDIDTEDNAPRTPLRRRSTERSPLEPIMNDLQIDERRPAQPVFGNSWDALLRPSRSAKTRQLGEETFESFRTSPSPKARPLDASFNGSQGRPALSEPAFGSFQSDVTSSFGSVGRQPEYGLSFMNGMDSMRSVNTDLTAPSPFASLRSEKPVFAVSEVAPVMAAVSIAASAVDLKWTRDEERYLIEMYDKYANHGLTGPIALSMSSHAPPKVVTKSVTRNAMAYWYIANFDKSESFGAINEQLRAQGLPSRMELDDWVPSLEAMQWIVSATQWRHDRKSTERRLSQLVSDRFVDPDKSKRTKAAPVETARDNLTNMFSTSNSTTTATGNSIPLGSMVVDLSSTPPRRTLTSMGPPPLPVRGEPRNVEMQIGMRVRTPVASSSLPGSFRAPGASASELGRAVKSLRGVPSVVESSNALGGATSGHMRQSQSLSAATGSHALGAALTFGPPLSSTKGKKRSREECADADFAQRHNAPNDVTRNSEGFDLPRNEDDMFGPPSLRDDRSVNGKRQNRARSHTLMAAAPASSDGGNASVATRNMANFKPKSLTFNSSTVSAVQRPSSSGRGSHHAPSSSMPSSLTPAMARSILHGVVEPRKRSIAEASRVRQPQDMAPYTVPTPPAPGSMVHKLPDPTAAATTEQRKRDYQYLQSKGEIEYSGKLNPETRRNLRADGRPMGMATSELHLLSGINSVDTHQSKMSVWQTAAAEQYEADSKLAAESPSERDATLAAAAVENRAFAASFNESRNVPPGLSAKKVIGMEGLQML